MTSTFALQGMPALSRLSAADRATVRAKAKLQYAALQHAIKPGATRAGQVAFLSNEIPGQPSAVAFVADNWLMQGGLVASVTVPV